MRPSSILIARFAGSPLRLSRCTRGTVMRSAHAKGSGTEYKVYQLSGTAKLHLQIGDLTEWSGDAIVNAANEAMLGGGGVDGAIHRAAGPKLYEACKQSPETRPGVRCPTGEARLTKGFNLPASYVIHTVGPVFASNKESEPLLYSAYKSSLEVAQKHNLKTIAFPAISCGVFGYPLREAASTAFKACQETGAHMDSIHFVLFGKETYRTFVETANSMKHLTPV